MPLIKKKDIPLKLNKIYLIPQSLLLDSNEIKWRTAVALNYTMEQISKNYINNTKIISI